VHILLMEFEFNPDSNDNGLNTQNAIAANFWMTIGAFIFGNNIRSRTAIIPTDGKFPSQIKNFAGLSKLLPE